MSSDGSANHIALRDLLAEVHNCRHCERHLPHGPRPVVRLANSAKLLIIGQAPGSKVHASGIPWDDPSGDRLRHWLGLSPEDFYDEARVAIVPMGFCYPGRGKSGDLPPRPECAPLWHNKLFDQLPEIELTLLVGRYAQDYYLEHIETTLENTRAEPDELNHKKRRRKSTTIAQRIEQTDWHTADYLPLVHPSPRNRRWLSNNPKFEDQWVPILKRRINKLMLSVR